MSHPHPIVPSDVDQRDFQYMELDVQRLRDSRFAAQSSGEAFRAGLLLWCASWHQVPAASLPGDDIELSVLAGYGRVVREWQAVKDEALHGFVLCSDGRWYHPVIALKALGAWEAKRRHAHGKFAERMRKENKARAEKGQGPVEIPTFEEWNSAGKSDSSAGNSVGWRSAAWPCASSERRDACLSGNWRSAWG